MVLLRFWERVREYGIKRILSDTDIKVSVLIVAGVLATEYLTCQMGILTGCIEPRSPVFVRRATDFAIALTMVILTGFSILIIFTDSAFLHQLKEIGVYSNIMFVFEYSIMVTVLTVILGIMVEAYSSGDTGFYLFLFMFIYMVFNVVYLIQLIVSLGNKKARFEMANSEEY